jgi:hypothetical protein
MPRTTGRKITVRFPHLRRGLYARPPTVDHVRQRRRHDLALLPRCASRKRATQTGEAQAGNRKTQCKQHGKRIRSERASFISNAIRSIVRTCRKDASSSACSRFCSSDCFDPVDKSVLSLTGKTIMRVEVECGYARIDPVCVGPHNDSISMAVPIAPNGEQGHITRATQSRRFNR